MELAILNGKEQLNGTGSLKQMHGWLLQQPEFIDILLKSKVLSQHIQGTLIGISELFVLQKEVLVY